MKGMCKGLQDKYFNGMHRKGLDAVKSAGVYILH